MNPNDSTERALFEEAQRDARGGMVLAAETVATMLLFLGVGVVWLWCRWS